MNISARKRFAEQVPADQAEKRLKSDGDDELETFQKKAIYVQMQEYKRLLQESKDENDSLSLKLESERKLVHSVCATLAKVEAGLGLPSSKIPQNASSDGFLSNLWESLEKAISSIPNNTASQINFNHVERISALESEILIASDHASELEKKANFYQENLRSAEKKIDRLKLLKTPKVEAVVTPKKEEEVELDLIKTKPEPKNYVADEKYLEIVATAETRLGQIESITREKNAISRDLEAVTLELAGLKASRKVEEELRYQLTLQDELKHRLEKALRQVESLESTRRQYIEKIKADEEARRKPIEEEMKKVNADLLRVRANRDSFQKKVDVFLAQEAKAKDYAKQTETLAQSRTERIKTLESELKRIKLCMAGNSGELGLVEFFKQDGKEQNPFRAIAEKVDTLLKENALLQETISNLRSDNSTEALLAEKKKLGMLSDELGKYKKLYGSLDTNMEVNQILEQKEKQLKSLTVKYEAAQFTENMLKQELETLGSAWSMLEEQNSKKILNLGEKEQEILSLTAEKVHMKQKIESLEKHRGMQQNLQNAQKRQAEKQLEQIRKLEELERSLSQQLQSMETRMAALAPEMEAEKLKANDLILQLAEARETLDGMKAKYDQLSIMLSEKTEAMEMEKVLTRKTLEQMAATKKKYDSLLKESGDPILQSQVEQYRLLLMCQSCNNNFKSHVLLKCMHTFCKGCVDDMYNSRQRKCPTCAIPFGIQDVKQVYL